MATNAELIFWLVAGLLGAIAFVMIVCQSNSTLYVSKETIQRIENGGRHL